MVLQALAFTFCLHRHGVGGDGRGVAHPVYSVLFLILAFFNAAALFLLIGPNSSP